MCQSNEMNMPTKYRWVKHHVMVSCRPAKVYMSVIEIMLAQPSYSSRLAAHPPLTSISARLWLSIPIEISGLQLARPPDNALMTDLQLNSLTLLLVLPLVHSPHQ